MVPQINMMAAVPVTLVVLIPSLNSDQAWQMCISGQKLDNLCV